MDKRGLFICLLVALGLVYVFSAGSVVAVENFVGNSTDNSFSVGVNLVNVPELMFVEDFVNANPSIQTVGFKDDFNRTVGYVNIFGGVGKNFIMYPGEEYEVFSSAQTEIQFPY